uniref:Uncharacterized protein n=1 Tax=Picea glauca TaxID=3330 RepID=A0A101LZM9_PICGL|nr:hypothetical protein ABT39_MTgene5280 [Picea glauca]QHR88856.1 hypothetical protein Q903MT_gene2875 [Picea sitchensis]
MSDLTLDPSPSPHSSQKDSHVLMPIPVTVSDKKESKQRSASYDGARSKPTLDQ